MHKLFRFGEPVRLDDGKVVLAYYSKKDGLIKQVNPEDVEFPKADSDGSEKVFDDANRLYIATHQNLWILPDMLHADEMLSPFDGREHFDQLEGDYVERCSNVLDRIEKYITERVYFADPAMVHILSVFILSTYLIDYVEYAPRIMIRGVSNCGKSALTGILKDLSHHGFLAPDITKAALFRMIEENDITPCMEEFQDYSTEAKGALKTVLKNGISRDSKVTVCETSVTHAFVPVTYSVYSPVVIVVQDDADLPVELVNRCVTIQMVAKPRKAKVTSRRDMDEVREIITELYSIRALSILEPKRFNVREVFEETVDETDDVDGVKCGGRRVRFSNRPKDIFCTFYTMAKLSHRENEIFNLFEIIQKENDSNDKSSKSARAMQAILAVLEEKMVGIYSYDSVMDQLANITTREIAAKYEELLELDHEHNPLRPVSTRTVTELVKGLGFKLERRCTDNQTKLNKSTLMEVFVANVNKFGTDEQVDLYSDLLTPAGEVVVNPMCQMGGELTDEQFREGA